MAADSPGGEGRGPLRVRTLLGIGYAGMAVALVGAIGVLSGEEPHLSWGDLDPWLVVFAIGVMVALGSAPYAIFQRHWTDIADKDARWDRVMTAWGGLALLVGAAFFAVGAIWGFAPATAAGSIAVVGMGCCALVFGTLVLFVLFGD